MKRALSLLIALMLGFTMFAGCGQANEPDLSTTEPPKTTSQPETSVPPETTLPETVPEPTMPETTAPAGTLDNPYMPGMYKVGVDIPAGEYLFLCISDSGAYVCISSDSNADDILENEVFDHTFIATVEDGQYLEASRCGFFIASECVIKINVDGSFSTGMYRVGVDIGPGEYKLTATDSLGYWCIYNDSTVPFDIVDNDLFETNTYVTVSNGQYLYVSDADAAPVDVELLVQETAPPETETPKSEFTTTYVLDKSEMRFHYVHCAILADVEDQETVDATRQTLIDEGYSPCEKCRS